MSLRTPEPPGEAPPLSIAATPPCVTTFDRRQRFLLQLCELELIERERKAAERRLKLARFPAQKTLDEFDFAARPSVNKPLVLELIK